MGDDNHLCYLQADYHNNKTRIYLRHNSDAKMDGNIRPGDSSTGRREKRSEGKEDMREISHQRERWNLGGS